MKNKATAFLALCLGVLITADSGVPSAYGQSSGPEIVVAQNNSGPGGFFRRLFGGNRRREAPRQEEFRLFPGFEQPGPAQPRRQRKARAAAPEPREVAAVEKSPDAKRALVVGDFMATALAKGLAEAYRENANVVVIDASSGSSGLVRTDYFDWAGKIGGIVAEQKPDAILVMIGGNDRQTINTDAGAIAPGSDAWRAAYRARVAAFADALKATGEPVLWGGLVPVEPSVMSSDYSAFNGIVRDQVETKGLRYVDMWNGFADEDGKYVAFGPDVRGQSVQLRADDGLNFTRAGQRKLAFFVEQELNDIFGGVASLIATATPADLNIPPGEAALIGPMVPLDALAAMGGDELSGVASGEEKGKVALEISSRVAAKDAELPPRARADSYLWPLPEPPAPTPPATLLAPAFGPR